MDGVEPTFVYVVSAIFYLLPIGFVVAAWVSVALGVRTDEIPKWRTNSVFAGVIFATVATLTALVFDYSWLRCGGRMHGMPPSPGLWQTIRPIFLYSFLAALLFALAGKGRSRLRLLAWGIAMVFVNFAIGMVALD